MKVIINESQYDKIVVNSKLSAMQRAVDLVITDKYDYVCKVVITPPNKYNLQYSAHVYFKDIVNVGLSVGKYFQMKENVLNEVWKTLYDFTNETTSLYQKSC